MKQNKLAVTLLELSDQINVMTTLEKTNTDSLVIKPFESIIISFINEFSKAIFTDKEFKQYPELISLAFWMRESSINKLKLEFFKRNENRLIAPRGLALHFAPANVDAIFIYSLFLSLLVGNQNIVRVSSNKSEQQQLIIRVLNQLLVKDKFRKLQSYITIINYAHSDVITKSLSSVCDVRVIWGGDSTVTKISAAPIPPKTIEIKFANKYSYALFGASIIANWTSDKVEELAKNFINDSYWFGQMGCSSPRNVYWYGKQDDVEIAKYRFWDAVTNQLADFPHQLSDADLVNKYVLQCDIAANSAIENTITPNMLASRIANTSDSLLGVQSEHCGGGLFFEDHLSDLGLLGQVVDRDIQTIVYAGIDKEQLHEAIQQWDVLPDRLVPCGEGLMFNRIWDGYDLLESFARFVTIK